MMKMFRTLATMALAATFAVTLTGCNSGPTIEDMIRNDVEETFDSIEEHEGEAWDNFVEGASEGASAEDYEKLGITPEEFSEAVMGDFDYEIEDIDVDEDNGKATVTVSCDQKQVAGTSLELQNQLNEWASAQDPTTLTEDAVYQKSGEMLLDILDDAPVETNEYDFDYYQDADGDWSFSELSMTEFNLHYALW